MDGGNCCGHCSRLRPGQRPQRRPDAAVKRLPTGQAWSRGHLHPSRKLRTQPIPAAPVQLRRRRPRQAAAPGGTAGSASSGGARGGPGRHPAPAGAAAPSLARNALDGGMLGNSRSDGARVSGSRHFLGRCTHPTPLKRGFFCRSGSRVQKLVHSSSVPVLRGAGSAALAVSVGASAWAFGFDFAPKFGRVTFFARSGLRRSTLL